jgi:hypothetical protein
VGPGPSDCIVCGRPIPQDGPAVVEYRDNREELTWGWVEFVEDWRGGISRFIDPVCFADAHGVAALVELVTKRERINRKGLWTLIEERDELRKRLGSSGPA